MEYIPLNERIQRDSGIKSSHRSIRRESNRNFAFLERELLRRSDPNRAFDVSRRYSKGAVLCRHIRKKVAVELAIFDFGRRYRRINIDPKSANADASSEGLRELIFEEKCNFQRASLPRLQTHWSVYGVRAPHFVGPVGIVDRDFNGVFIYNCTLLLVKCGDCHCEVAAVSRGLCHFEQDCQSFSVVKNLVVLDFEVVFPGYLGTSHAFSVFFVQAFQNLAAILFLENPVTGREEG